MNFTNTQEEYVVEKISPNKLNKKYDSDNKYFDKHDIINKCIESPNQNVELSTEEVKNIRAYKYYEYIRKLIEVRDHNIDLYNENMCSKIRKGIHPTTLQFIEVLNLCQYYNIVLGEKNDILKY